MKECIRLCATNFSAKFCSCWFYRGLRNVSIIMFYRVNFIIFSFHAIYLNTQLCVVTHHILVPPRNFVFVYKECKCFVRKCKVTQGKQNFVFFSITLSLSTPFYGPYTTQPTNLMGDAFLMMTDLLIFNDNSE